MCRFSVEENSLGKFCDKFLKIWVFLKFYDLGLIIFLDILVYNYCREVFYLKFEVIEIVYWGLNIVFSYDIFLYLY